MSVFHKNLTSTDLHESKITTGSGYPSSTPNFIGQSYYDLTTNTFFVATGTSSSLDWKAAPVKHVGTHLLSLVTTADSSVVLPLTGTLATLSNSETFLNKTLGSGTIIRDSDQSNTLTLPNLTADDEIVTENIAQTLLNKTITDTTNTIAANWLKTTGAPVVIDGAAPPIATYVLTALSATTAAWQPTPSSGHVIQDETVALTQRSKLNFTGGGISATDGGLGPDVTNVKVGTWVEDRTVAPGAIFNFNLSQTPMEVAGVFVFVNGLMRSYGALNDYTISGTIVTFNFIPAINDIIVFKYQY